MTERETNPDAGRWAASDLSRVLPTGSLQQPDVTPPTPYAELNNLPGPQAGGPAVVTPLPRPKPYRPKPVSSGLQVGPVGRVIVGAAMVVTLGFMLYTAWHNIFP
jgi:hypothetical protein